MYLIIALIVLLILAVGWISTAGIVWLICLCFGWEFSWLIATGVWLILCLLSGCFRWEK